MCNCRPQLVATRQVKLSVGPYYEATNFALYQCLICFDMWARNTEEHYNISLHQLRQQYERPVGDDDQRDGSETLPVQEVPSVSLRPQGPSYVALENLYAADPLRYTASTGQ